MDDKSFTIRVPRRWARIAMIVGVAALIVAPLTAVASHVFNDVPDSHTFHDNITWLADADVTRGCNPPDNTEFCPDDNVTRGQMAAFMQRFAQYIDAEDGTPGQADNASTANTANNASNLDGDGPDAYRTIIQADGCTGSDCTDHSGSVISNATVEVNAPNAGVLEISSNMHVFADGAGADDLVQLWAAVDQTANDGCGPWLFAPGAAAEGSYAATHVPGSEAGALSTTTAVEIPAGNHTVNLCSMSLQAPSTQIAALTTVWSQGGSGLESSSVSVSGAELDSLAAEFEGADLSHIEN